MQLCEALALFCDASKEEVQAVPRFRHEALAACGRLGIDAIPYPDELEAVVQLHDNCQIFFFQKKKKLNLDRE